MKEQEIKKHILEYVDNWVSDYYVELVQGVFDGDIEAFVEACQTNIDVIEEEDPHIIEQCVRELLQEGILVEEYVECVNPENRQKSNHFLTIRGTEQELDSSIISIKWKGDKFAEWYTYDYSDFDTWLAKQIEELENYGENEENTLADFKKFKEWKDIRHYFDII